MANKIRTLVAALVIPLVFSAGGASAALGSYSGTCGGEFTALYKAITDDPTIYLSKKNAAWNMSSLVVKLDSAEGKLVSGNYSDAITYLEAISAKVTEWADLAPPKQKITDPGADKINIAVSTAIGCVTLNIK